MHTIMTATPELSKALFKNVFPFQVLTMKLHFITHWTCNNFAGFSSNSLAEKLFAPHKTHKYIAQLQKGYRTL